MSPSDEREGPEEEPAEGLDLRLVPLSAAAWAASWWAVAPSPRGLGLVLLLWLVTVVVLLRRALPMLAIATTATLLVVAGLASVRSQQLTRSELSQLGRDQASAVVEARLDADAKRRPANGVLPESATALATATLVSARGETVVQRMPIRVIAKADLTDSLVDVQPGALVRLEGRLRAPSAGDHLSATLTLRTAPTLLEEPAAGARLVNHLRQGLRDAMGLSPPEAAGLLPSLVVGDTGGLDPELEEDFKRTALTHLTAVSGTNVTLTLVFLLGAARWMGLRGWSVRLLGVGGVVGFVILCRAEPSVVRAGAMGLVALAGLGMSDGRGRGLRNLALAVWLLLMLDPWLARSTGFTLSALATAGILWWAGRWARAMAWAPSWMAESVAVPLAAQLATQPVVTGISGSISVVGLATNALAGPFVGPATVLGLVTALLALVSPSLARITGWLAGWCVQPIIWVAHTGAALPAASWRWPASPLLLGLLTLACLLVAVLVPSLLRRRMAVAILSGCLVVASFREPRPPGWPGAWQAVFCDVGQGDATVLRAGERSAVVVDTGPEDESAVRCLRELGVREVTLLVVTHYHDDHIRGLARLLDALPVRAALLNPALSPSSGSDSVRRLLAIHQIPVSWAATGQHTGLGAVTWRTAGLATVSHEAGEDGAESSAENNSSIVAIATVEGMDGALTVVLGGDVEPAGQQEVVARGWSPGAQVLKMPHHGSGRQDRKFWCDSGARLAVASAGHRNGYRHPSAKALQLAAECGQQVARTDLEGAIAVWRRGEVLEVRRQRDGPP